jgi:hypothetical protein
MTEGAEVAAGAAIGASAGAVVSSAVQMTAMADADSSAPPTQVLGNILSIVVSRLCTATVLTSRSFCSSGC